jgi:hypothetical protein
VRKSRCEKLHRPHRPPAGYPARPRRQVGCSKRCLQERGPCRQADRRHPSCRRSCCRCSRLFSRSSGDGAPGRSRRATAHSSAEPADRCALGYCVILGPRPGPLHDRNPSSDRSGLTHVITGARRFRGAVPNTQSRGPRWAGSRCLFEATTPQIPVPKRLDRWSPAKSPGPTRLPHPNRSGCN